jgi:hypothetical protein
MEEALQKQILKTYEALSDDNKEEIIIDADLLKAIVAYNNKITSSRIFSTVALSPYLIGTGVAMITNPGIFVPFAPAIATALNCSVALVPIVGGGIFVLLFGAIMIAAACSGYKLSTKKSQNNNLISFSNPKKVRQALMNLAKESMNKTSGQDKKQWASLIDHLQELDNNETVDLQKKIVETYEALTKEQLQT